MTLLTPITIFSLIEAHFDWENQVRTTCSVSWYFKFLQTNEGIAVYFCKPFIERCYLHFVPHKRRGIYFGRIWYLNIITLVCPVVLVGQQTTLKLDNTLLKLIFDLCCSGYSHMAIVWLIVQCDMPGLTLENRKYDNNLKLQVAKQSDWFKRYIDKKAKIYIEYIYWSMFKKTAIISLCIVHCNKTCNNIRFIFHKISKWCKRLIFSSLSGHFFQPCKSSRKS